MDPDAVAITFAIFAIAVIVIIAGRIKCWIQSRKSYNKGCLGREEEKEVGK